jgi:sugar phosphate isomerase/epimerase
VQRGDLSKDIPYVLQITCSDWFERWNQPPQSARTTNQAQQHLHPGDRIFDLTEIIAASPLSALPVKNIYDHRRPGVGGLR